MHTHFHPPTSTWYTPGTCETCGEPVQEPNAIKLLNFGEVNMQLQHDGLPLIVAVDRLPPEIWYDESTGMTVCSRCST